MHSLVECLNSKSEVAQGFYSGLQGHRAVAALEVLKPLAETREFLLLEVYICADQTKALSLKAERDFPKS